MISSKEEYKEYLYADKCALGLENKKKLAELVCRCEKDYIWHYEKLLRRTEYVKNCLKDKSFIYNIYFKFLTYRLLRWKLKLGFDIPPNTFGKGLRIVHTGPIIVSGFARIGDNCTIYPMSNIGNDGKVNGELVTPKIGENCFISTGVKIIGSVKICNNVTIGAGAVVVKDIIEEDTTWGGGYLPRRFLIEY